MFDVEEARLAQLVAMSKDLGFMDDYIHWQAELKKYREGKA